MPVRPSNVPAESVYAVFEIKPTFSRQWLRDAGEKAASVRALRRTSVPVIAGGGRRSPIRPRPILAGLLADSNNETLTVLDAKNQRTVVKRTDVEELRASELSLMPENVLTPLNNQEIRDLFAYLRSK